MPAKVAIINYGMGNIASVTKALDKLQVESIVTNTESEISTCSHIILPGVGAFDYAMHKINQYQLKDVISEQVLLNHKPILGICLGMQLLATYGTEGKGAEGLGLIQGKVDKMKIPEKYRLPHLGWNTISTSNNSFFNDFDKEDFYFIHSYHFEPEQDDHIAAKSNNGIDFVACVQRDHILGTQFHPEKSQKAGLSLIAKFIEYA